MNEETKYHAEEAIEEAKSAVGSLADATKEHVIKPAKQVAGKVSAYASEKLHDARDAVSRQLSNASGYAGNQVDHAAKWISDNPLKALGVTFLAGFVLAQVFTVSRKK